MLEAHVVVRDMPVSETASINDAISTMLHREFKIGHVIIQFDSDANCGDDCQL